MKWILIAAALALTVLHQDFWWWDDKTLVFGFLPTGLAYHVGYTIMTAAFWAVAVFYAWPAGLEKLAGAEEEKPPPP